MAQAEVCADTELRKLRPAELYTLGQILTIADSWKKLMAIVPQESCANLPKFNAEHFSLIEQAAQQQRRSAAEIFLDEWSTMGRRRPTLKSLLDLLVQAELFRAADYVAGDVLKAELPKRPERGPAAAVDISDEALEKLLEENYSPDSDSSVIRSEISTEQFLYYPEELLDDAGGNNRSTKLANEENHAEASGEKRGRPLCESPAAPQVALRSGGNQDGEDAPGNSTRICDENRGADAAPSFPANPQSNYHGSSPNLNLGCPATRVQFQQNLNPPGLGVASPPNFAPHSPNLALKNLSNLGPTNAPSVNQNAANLPVNQSPHFVQSSPSFNQNPGTSHGPGYSPGQIRNAQTSPGNGCAFNDANPPVSDLIKFTRSVESAEPAYAECKTEFIPVTILQKQELPTEELPVCLNSKIFSPPPGNSSSIDFNIPMFIDTSSSEYDSAGETTGTYSGSSAANYGNFSVAGYNTAVDDNTNAGVRNIAIARRYGNANTNPALMLTERIIFGGYAVTGSSGDVIIDIERSDSSLGSSNGGVEPDARKDNCGEDFVSNRDAAGGSGMNKTNDSSAANFLANEMNSLELPVCIAELSSRFDSNLTLGEARTVVPGGMAATGVPVRGIGVREEVLDSTELPVTVLDYENV